MTGSARGRPKRRRGVSDLLERVNNKADEQFVKEHLCPADPNWTLWKHPKTGASLTVSLVGARTITKADLGACFDLVEETSYDDYAASPDGWNPRHKREEMVSPELRYLLVKDDQQVLRAFVSLMPTVEEGQPVVYCYEIHLKPELRGTGLSKLLMQHLESVAAHTPPITKVMLTCFLSNKHAHAFYRRQGFEKDAISPKPRKLRYGKTFEPGYVIMSKAVQGKEPHTRTEPGSGKAADLLGDNGHGPESVNGSDYQV